MKLTPGTKVTIRSWEDMASSLGLDSDGDINSEQCENLHFLSEMKDLCGTQQTVMHVIKGTTNTFCTEECDCWIFHTNHTEEFKEDSNDAD